VLRAHPDVLWCRVSSVRAPLVGSLARAELVMVPAADDSDRAVVERTLHAHCSRHLPDFAVPRIWKFREGIPTSAALKSEEASRAD